MAATTSLNFSFSFSRQQSVTSSIQLLCHNDYHHANSAIVVVNIIIITEVIFMAT